MQQVTSILVDRRNYFIYRDKIKKELREANYSGLDIETHNRNAHEGIKQINLKPSKNVFDINRTIITGLSVYAKDSEFSYYFNLNHLDKENRLTWEEVKDVLVSPLWIIHNAAFELTMFKATYGWDFDNYICTLQMAVSAYGPDNYDYNKFCSAPLGEMGQLLPRISRAFENYDITSKRDLTPEQGELLGQVCGKSSKAAHSYNGWIKEISYGYGLKKAVKSFFGFQMETYQQCLDNSSYAKMRNVVLKSKNPELRKVAYLFKDVPDMGHLTGEEVTSYGADDSFWCLKLYEKLIEFMQINCPNAISTFFTQENPMVKIYSNMQLGGLKINTEAVIKKRNEERLNLARVFKQLKQDIKTLLPFDSQPCEGLVKAGESWYIKNYQKYRAKILEYAYSKDFDESEAGIKEQILQVNGGTANSYEEGSDKIGILNLSHYMPLRVIFYDLLKHKVLKSKGKVQSDKDAQGRMKENFPEDSPQHRILEVLTKISQVDQVCKLYLNPYLQLIDPDTDKVYPSISSELATRRMSMSNPNGQQLAKRGESVYVRGFYKPDYDDHVIMSSDWQNMELVIPAEMSGDPEFVRCFSTLPYEDLHASAAASMLGMTDEEFNMLKKLEDTIDNIRGIPFKNNKSELLKPSDFRKWARTELGKGANFSYAFSGALSTLAEKLGWTDEQHWAKVDAYRSKFPIFEEWRITLIQTIQRQGYVELPDGHRRFRLEATSLWRQIMYDKFVNTYNTNGVKNFFQKFARLTQTRANNQAVNSMVQGTAACLTKRSMKRLIEEIKARGWTDRECRVMLPIHDEIVCSVHKDLVLEFNQLIRKVMKEHSWLFKKVILNSTVSIGRTFEPFNKDKAPKGQIEIDEAPKNVTFIPEEKWDKALNDNEILKVVDYLFDVA